MIPPRLNRIIARVTTRITTRIATSIYVLALRAFPRRHRATYAADMIDTFERELQRQRARGLGQALWFAIAACLNVVTAGIGERRRRRLGLGAVGAGASVSWIDVRLAWRMLLRYPGLGIVSVIGLAVGIAIAAATFTIVDALLHPVLPLPDGERVVSLVTLDAATTNSEPRVLHDTTAWRALSSVHDLGMSLTVGRTLIADGGQPETVAVAQMTASGFRVAGVAPALGRYLLAEDERQDAADVVVIGYDVWQRRFSGDRDILSRSIQLGGTSYAVVGVMPDGFGFPVNHRYWIPWRLDPSLYAPRTGPPVMVFARLVPGATIERAQAELAAIGQRMAAALPATHAHLRPAVVPYAHGFSGMGEPDNVLAMRAIQLAIVMLLIVVSVNVAILVYARTATRQGEIAVRAALGASRRRIVVQLFVEALLLAAVAAVAGLAVVSLGLEQLEAALRQMSGEPPFWMTLRLSTEGVIDVAGLGVLAAGIIGIVPAVKATGRNVQTRLQGLSAGSGSGMHMGRLWTLLIVIQVALTVAVLPAAMYHAFDSLRFRMGDRGFASKDVLTTRLALDDQSVRRSALAPLQTELERRLEHEPGVTAVTFSLTNAGEEHALVLEAEGVPPPIDLVDYNIVQGTKQGHLVRFNRVALDFFDAFDVPLLMGRSLRSADRGVVVNHALIDQVFGGANPLGRRIRYVGRSREADERDAELDRWYEIVGVIPDFPAAGTLGAPPVGRLYHAASPGDLIAPMMSVRVRGALPSTFAATVREIGAAVAPDLQLRDVSSFTDAAQREQGVRRLIGLTVTLAMLSVVILSAAGIYALMSLTVARRRREIGIRVVLGADPIHVLAGIFSRAARQLAIGAACGMLGAVALERALEGEMFQGHGAIILPIVAVFMTIVGLLATLGPARRGLSIHPTEALKDE